MDINERPNFNLDDGLTTFILSCIDNARYEGFMSSESHDFVVKNFKLLVHDFIAYELFINALKSRDSSIEIERSNVVWL